MGWLEDLRNKVTRAVSQNPVVTSLRQPRRLAGRILGSSFVRPSVGFVPEVVGVVASELLPKGSTPKALLDAGLYLASGPLNITASFAGSTPQGDDAYANWQRLGYKSREDMISRINRQKAVDAVVATRPPHVYIADDYGPPRPVQYPDGTILVGDYRVDRFKTPAARETATAQPVRETESPAASRPVEESRPPVTREMPPNAAGGVPASPPPPSKEEVIKSEMLLKAAADQQRTTDLINQMKEFGVTGGMTEDNMRRWVASHSDLAQRLISDRQARGQRLAKEFAGFSGYEQ